jgi:purine-binding chemotaxis protein CheW
LPRTRPDAYWIGLFAHRIRVGEARPVGRVKGGVVAVGQGDVLIFEAGGRRFGLAAALREIARAVAITPLPGGPASVAGVINVRGNMVPVIDVRRALGLAPGAVALSDHLVILHVDGAPLALRVDRALELHAGAAGRLVRLDDGLVPVLEPRDFLNADEWAALRAWLGQEAGA